VPHRDDQALTWLVVDAFATERRLQGRSIEDVADAAGVHRTSLGLVERHLRGVTLDFADRVATSLGLSLGAVVTEAERARAEQG